ncbi:N-formylglutamate amidohydrolase [Primorskyibacter sp. S87]|uniref:N-formylglutamate amidohydrolase n=1 Tax=Primorskyibacter sp. S87 TaxID=3415126 RepID=UPI003C7D1662
MPQAAYYLTEPKKRLSSVVFASPHSSSDYPEDFVRSTILDPKLIRSSEDAFVDLLFDAAPAYGSPFLKAGAPRAYLDLNRACDELDPALVEGARRNGHNPRVASGLGVIPRVVANGRPIYRGKLPMAEAKHRLDRYWHPYHRKLQDLLHESREIFGQAILIDCHSMPHEAIDGVSRGMKRRPEIVLGDRFGAAAARDIVDHIEELFLSAGFVVSRNSPFAGAYITQAYGRPSRNQHAIQIEIDRSLYMDERQVRPSPGFDAFRETLNTVISRIAAIGYDQTQMAAE